MNTMEWPAAIFFIASVLSLFVGAKFSVAYLFIDENTVGLVRKKFAFKRLAAGSLIALRGEAGFQADTLSPGWHFGYFIWQYEIIKERPTHIEPGKIGLVVANDGAPEPFEYSLAPDIACDDFQNARKFLTGGGQRGRQLRTLPPGTYRINTAFFTVQTADAIVLQPGQIGLVTTFAGQPLPDGEYAGDPIDGHDEFQNAQAFVTSGGLLGPQQEVLEAGTWNINPWFASVEAISKTEVPPGFAGVVTSVAVPKGTWTEPLLPGHYSLHPLTTKVHLLPTTPVTITRNFKVNSADGFSLVLSTTQIVQLKPEDAPQVVIRFISAEHFINSVLATVSEKFFTDFSKKHTLVELLKTRRDLQQEAFLEFRNQLQEYPIRLNDLRIDNIGEIVNPANALTSTIFKDKPYFCPAPFSSFVQDQDGRSGPCPYNSGCFNLADVKIKDRWSHAGVTRLQEQHLNGEKPALCQRCYTEEEAGFLSRRHLEHTLFLRYTEKDILEKHYLKGPKSMVIRLSNNCNYACRTCHSLDSGLFKPEGDFYFENYNDKNNRYFQTHERKEFSADDMHELYQIAGHVEHIEFYGGEPLLNTTHHVLLEKLIESGRSENISLYYCTNGSHKATDARKKLWTRFNSVRFHFSLDGVNESYHYLRWPGQWEKAEQNIVDYTRQLPTEIAARVFYGANVTVSNLNIFYLPEIFARLATILPASELNVTTVHEPAYYSVVQLPDHAKHVIAEKLGRSPYKEAFSGLISYMFSKKAEPQLWKDFVIWTEKKDKYRRVDIRKSLPEFYNLIRPEYNDALGDFKAVARDATSHSPAER